MIVTSRRKFLFGLAAAALATQLPRLAPAQDTIIIAERYDHFGFKPMQWVEVWHIDGTTEILQVVSVNNPTITVRK